jgi:hypothetical protein
MTLANPSMSAIQPDAAYETLRAAVLSGHSNGQAGLAVIIHRGLRAWLGTLTEVTAPRPSAIAPASSSRSTCSASTPNELTRVLAGIIVSLTKEGSAHA